MPKNETIRYCDHPAPNTILNYYTANTRQLHIRLRINVNLPEKLPISDVELCGIVGNLFDNGINACAEIPETERHIDLTISCPVETRFGIVLSSIASIAEQYNGTATFRHEGKTFFSGIMIPMKDN